MPKVNQKTSKQKPTKKPIEIKKEGKAKVERLSEVSKSEHVFDSRKKIVVERMRRAQQRGHMRRKAQTKEKDIDELDIHIVSIRRVSKVHAGGKRLRLSVMVVIGDKKGRVGVAIAKGKDVRDAEGKAVRKAQKRMVLIPLKGQTIPHETFMKFGAAKILLKPAAPGTGVIAGGAVRAVVEVAGIKDILSKVLGTKNTIPNVYATYEALKRLRLTRFD